MQALLVSTLDITRALGFGKTVKHLTLNYTEVLIVDYLG